MIETHIWIAFATVSAINIVTPGPANVLAVNTGMQYGQRVVAAFALGNILGLACIGAVVAIGFAQILTKSAVVMEILRWIGAGYLVWLGIKLWRRSSLPETARSVSGRRMFGVAFLNAITNPKPLLFFATVLPLFLDQREAIAPQVGILVATFMAISFVSLNTYGALAAKAGALLRQPRAFKMFNRGSGALLVGYGTALAVSR
ncbi:LysE family translocator [Microvirga flavescens]|uniref:LysE family translocator n=1 Tax=Microvirga flavescens TaxID=2249811 RepID=UPI000DD91DA9|nr:LysE family translocator [Microvirga flavescens]